MIRFSTSMQKRNDQVPKVLADWVNDRDRRYPDVVFEVSYAETPVSKRAEDHPLVKKYSRFYSATGGVGISQVVFPYLEERWYIRIIGHLTSEQRNEVAGLTNTPNLEKLNEKTFGKPRTSSEPVFERAVDLEPLTPNERMTSAFSTTGQEIQDADATFKTSGYNDPSIKDDTPLMTLLGQVKDPFELGVLTFKLHAASELTKNGALPGEKEGARLSFGHQIPFGDDLVRIDLLEEFEDGSVIAVRCLGKKERLHETETAFWENLSKNKLTKSIIFAHEAELHPMDQALISLLQQGNTGIESILINK